MVIKPLQGSGGQGVFLVRKNDLGNLNQMIEAVSRDGYVIAQEYLPEAAEGDMRLFVMNGAAAEIQGQSTPPSAGSAPATISAAISMPAAKRPRPWSTSGPCGSSKSSAPSWSPTACSWSASTSSGDKLMEINVFSPGGLGSAQSFEGVNFATAVIMALERKVQYMGYYQRNFNNIDMATL